MRSSGSTSQPQACVNCVEGSGREMNGRITNSYNHRQLCASGLLLFAALLSGCTVGPDFVRPTSGLEQATLIPRVSYPDGTQIKEADVPSNWWLLFDDPVLAELEAQAQTSSLTLQMASMRIQEAQAQLGIVSSQLWPAIGAGGTYSRQALSENGRLAALGAPTDSSNYWQLGFNASWELDLWGRARRANESAAASLEAATFEREAVRVSLTAEIARAYLLLRQTQAQIGIAESNQEIATRVQALTESRQRNGVATRFDVATARSQVAIIDAMLPELLQRRNALMNTLALLLGEAPRTLDTALQEALPLPSLPEAVPVGLPSELARRRPDIQRAEAQLHAATAAIGVAKADFYPRISLTGALGTESFEASDLIDWDSRAFSVGPTVYLPIFQGGRLTQRLALTEARQKTAAISYRQTVLSAWHEVDNALDAWVSQQRQHADLLIAYDQSRQALRAAERGYEEGSADYLTVLIAQRNVLTSQTRLNSSSTNVALALVNLYKSLGGGWAPGELALLSTSADDTHLSAQEEIAGERP
ncbi:efflux transporter, outer membrane factor (OMF) lipoprotein, NodT family [Sphingopyxis indica]|uniref:Efflux transporter, outer membrane factor (OMF) lipoprotein, NodT family n=2 Tax=Sphingopyxis indica TaxID=436663 RepID=A0A239I3P4_9SPHN|nr:efflux transporter, outer membrane factor (OMF) lipoprotein, NodT family [Sphingopyxis indica]